MTKTQCLSFVPIYSVRWRNQMDSMCLINRRFILNICVRSVKFWVTTVVVCRPNTAGLPSHHRGSLLMEAVHINSLQWVFKTWFMWEVRNQRRGPPSIPRIQGKQQH